MAANSPMMHLHLRLALYFVLGWLALSMLTLGVGRLTNLPDNEILYTAAIGSTELHIYRMDIAHGLSMRLKNNDASDTQPAWSPDGSQIAYNTVFPNGLKKGITIFVQDVETHQVKQLVNDPAGEYYPAWSPDGHYMTYATMRYGSTPELMLRDLQTGSTRRLTNNTYSDNYPTWSPDSRHIAFVSNSKGFGDSDIDIVDIQTGDIQPAANTTGTEVFPSWSPDGQYILYIVAGFKNAMFLWDVVHARSKLLFTHFSRVTGAPDWSLDGRYIIYDDYVGNMHNSIFRLDVAACLQNAANCMTQQLTLAPGFYISPRWRPHQP